MTAELSWKVGDVLVTRVQESLNAVSRSHLIPAATDEAIAGHRDWLVPAFLDANDNLMLSIHGLVVEADGLRILVDTCIGNRPVPTGSSVPARPASPFVDHLEAAGFPPESFDIVLCTHLHFDHVGWNTQLVDGSWVPTFPNARYLFGRIEWEHWSSAAGTEHYATADEHAVRPLVENGHADLVEAGHRVCASVWLEPTPGHTPGHVAVRIASQGQEALITGDLSHHPVQWAELDWSVTPDVDPIQSAATRRRLLDEHLDGETLIIGTHYPPPTAGHLVTTPDGVRFPI